MIFRKRFLPIIIFIICIAINFNIEFFAISKTGNHEYSDDCLVIATNNIYSQGNYLDENRDNPDSLYQIFKKINADVIFIQEFDSARCSLLSEWLKHDGYILYQKRHNLIYGENAIYSKYPIKDICFEHDGLFMYATLLFKDRLIRLINCHLSSNNIGEIVTANNGNPDWIKSLPQYITSINKSGKKRINETLILKQHIDSCLKSNLPIIVGGDINDVGGSKPIAILEGKGDYALNDAWWHNGLGAGITYHGYKWLNFRLDHIFYSNHFRVTKTKIYDQPFSDHKILTATLKNK